MTVTGEISAADKGENVPRWLAASLNLNEGRDPLGLQTTTQDRLMPLLLPGLLELSRRARYFSFHAYLLDEYRRRRFPADPRSLSTFIKRREWEFGLAVQRCPRRCGSSPVGKLKLGSLAQETGPFRRGESVESALGGYGLYYRSPLIDFGIVARSGTLLGEQPIPIDVLRPTQRAADLAHAFREAVQDTAYHSNWMVTDDPIPVEVIDELAQVACLCGLDAHPQERAAIRAAIFDTDPQENEVVLEELPSETVTQRRRSVAHYLSIVSEQPNVVQSEADYREAMWTSTDVDNEEHRVVAGQWAALIAKDVWQEALCSIWTEFCQTGLAATRQWGRGLSWDETREMTSAMVAGPPGLRAAEPTSNLVGQLVPGGLTVTIDGDDTAVVEAPLEKLRKWTVEANTAASGLIVLLELARRMRERNGEGWLMASHIESGWQPSVAAVVAGLDAHLTDDPAVGDTLWWLVSRFVVPVHERIAYSKLPELTFRFRWEEGLLRFQDHGVGRFPLAAIRNEPLALLTRDLGFWDDASDGSAKLTPAGVAFLDGAFQ